MIGRDIKGLAVICPQLCMLRNAMALPANLRVFTAVRTIPEQSNKYLHWEIVLRSLFIKCQVFTSKTQPGHIDCIFVSPN